MKAGRGEASERFARRGALHDEGEVARTGIPTARDVQQSLKGISHNKVENTREEHLALAVTAFEGFAAKMLCWMESR